MDNQTQPMVKNKWQMRANRLCWMVCDVSLLSVVNGSSGRESVCIVVTDAK